MKKLITQACYAISFLIVGATAQAESSGHVDFADLSSFYGEPKVEINLGATLLGMVSTFSQQQDPEVAELLSKLEFVKVKVYNIQSEKKDKAFETVDSVTGMLRKKKWEPIVSVNEPNEKVRIFSKLTDEVIDGLVVMAVDGKDGEAVFINIVGEIHPSQISKVTESLNVDLDIE